MKKVTHIQVDFNEDEHADNVHFYSVGNDSPIESLFSFLIAEGIYDDIQITKHFSTSKEVMRRLKGK